MLEVNYSTYDLATGRITQRGFGIPFEEPGKGWVLGQWDPDAYKVEDGKAVLIVRTPEQIEEEAAKAKAAALAVWRSEAAMTVADFAIASMAAGYITEADADAWVMRKGVPGVVAAAVGSLPAGQRTAARLRIMGATTVRRDSPFVALLAKSMNLTDAQVDALFGGPPP